MRTAIFLVVIALLGSVSCSLPVKTTLQHLFTHAKETVRNILDATNSAKAEVDELSGPAQQNALATSEILKNALKESEQTIEFPLGLSEQQSAELTTIDSLAKDIQSEVSNFEVPPPGALRKSQYYDLIKADEDLKFAAKGMSVPATTPAPVQPVEVATTLAQATIDTKKFNEIPKKSKPTPYSTTYNASLKRLTKTPLPPKPQVTTYAQTPATPASESTADSAGAGDLPARRPIAPTRSVRRPAQPVHRPARPIHPAHPVRPARPIHPAHPVRPATHPTHPAPAKPSTTQASPASSSNKEVVDAVNKLSDRITEAFKETRNVVPIPFFGAQPNNQNEEFKKLAKRMKSLEKTITSTPTVDQTIQQQKDYINKRNIVLDAIKKIPDTKPAADSEDSLSHEDITATKVSLMSELVTSLDELGRYFGEDELIEEDDNLSIKEDPNIVIADSNLKAAANRLRSDLAANPNPFKEHSKLRDVAHYLHNPVPISHSAPSKDQNANNLEYLKSLRNYVVSLKKAEQSSP